MSELYKALSLIFSGIEMLQEKYPQRQFSIDGRLVGDIGEMLASIHYDIELDKTSQPTHDGTTSDRKRVQIKATFKDQLTFKEVPDLYLGLKINRNGSFEEIYNGPPENIIKKYSERAGFGETLLSFPNKVLKELSSEIKD